ncbi:Holliday junction resolvase RecU [uncultured Trichococcus sp.]|uniref:Holliday junction resolvase RecU n=1 Tax=uncultured Trichococcus sp. TaxID=189665 RepID=UPI0029C649FA|nr:Holliday junction resolvase RecU [uncultured Trichococcus sp.]
MAVNYPNGKKFHAESHTPKTAKRKEFIYSNRGMTLEEEINSSNKHYLSSGKAVIHKKPTPIEVVKVDYPKRSAAVIKEAYYRQSSTTDYNGVYKGHYLDFEAKETKNKTAIPLSNFHEHQIIHMKRCIQQQGITFVLIRFSFFNRVFLLNSSYLIDFWENTLNNGRKSIPLAYIEDNGIEVAYGFNPRLAYLDAVDKMLERTIK